MSDPKSDFNPMSDLRCHVSDVHYPKMCGENWGGEDDSVEAKRSISNLMS